MFCAGRIFDVAGRIGVSAKVKKMPHGGVFSVTFVSLSDFSFFRRWGSEAVEHSMNLTVCRAVRDGGEERDSRGSRQDRQDAKGTGMPAYLAGLAAWSKGSREGVEGADERVRAEAQRPQRVGGGAMGCLLMSPRVRHGVWRI